MLRLAFLLAVLGLMGCSAHSVSHASLEAELEAELRPAAPLRTLEDYAAHLRRIDAAMEAAVGRARAERPAQCDVLVYGAKPCGGPSTARVYSRVDGDPERLHALAALYTRVERERNERFGLVSDCALAPVPVPRLEDGRCVPARPSPSPRSP